MSKALAQKIVFMKQTKSYAQLARDTGVAYKTILAIKNTGISPSRQITGAINKYYNKWSYGWLKSQGWNARSASQLRGGSVTRLRDLTEMLNRKIDYYTEGGTQKRIRSLLNKGILFDENEIRKSIRDKMVDSIQDSLQPVEEMIEGHFS